METWPISLRNNTDNLNSLAYAEGVQKCIHISAKSRLLYIARYCRLEMKYFQQLRFKFHVVGICLDIRLLGLDRWSKLTSVLWILRAHLKE